MPRYPGAQWHAVGNEGAGGMTGYQFLVLHTMQGTLQAWSKTGGNSRRSTQPATRSHLASSCQCLLANPVPGRAGGCYQAMSKAPFSSIGSSVKCPVLSSILPRFPP